MRTHPSRAAISALAFLTALGALPSSPATAASKTYSHDLALGIVAGYAWADGWISDGIYGYRGPTPLREQYREAAVAAGGRWRGDGHRTRVSGLGTLGLVTHGSLSERVIAGSRDLRIGVIVGMIPCEGSTGGLVWDNPDRATAESVVKLFATVGIKARIEGTRFLRVYVDPSDYAFFADLPFASWKRVPGA